MSSLNKVMLIGNLGVDPEVRQTANGTQVSELRIATNEVWRDANGTNQTRTEWHRVVVWGRQAENVGRFLKKGSMIYVEGRLQTREWQDKEGQKRYTTEIIASQVTFLDRQGGGGGGGQRGGSSDDFGGGNQGGGGFGGGNQGGGGFGGGNQGGGGFGDSGFNDSDIPF